MRFKKSPYRDCGRKKNMGETERVESDRGEGMTIVNSGYENLSI